MLRFLLQFSSPGLEQIRKNPTNQSNFDVDL
nr:MAG TPA: hypothetical protein [Caudoviricetes sp.]